jgi:hypothetical protein
MALGRRLVVAASVACCAALPMAQALGGDHGDTQPRPVDIRCSTTFQFQADGTVLLAGSCQSRHLGKVAVRATQTAEELANHTLLITNNVTYTAANGDQLFADFVGLGTPNATGITFSGTETYRRGTGRFAEAVGSAALTGSALYTSPTGGTGEYLGLGNIAH